jgi:TonB-linked SusC/RagA family outer membrane protein
MRKNALLLVIIFLLCCISTTYAQERIITGSILSENKEEAVLSASIVNQRTKKATQSTSNGSFTIRAEKGDQLVITSIGFVRKTITVGDNNDIAVLLQVNQRKLSEVIVTAFGVKKDKRGTGNATQTISGDEIAETQRENFLNSIQGRVAGATVTPTSGAPGASSQIVLRGFNSISGNNSPLIVVDGLPLNNSVFNQHRLSSDGDNRNNDYTNRAADINPEDIESITILKGPEAAALYGTEAGSGAIIITTRKGKIQKLKVGYDNNFRMEKITRFHETQKVYDVGTNGTFSPTVRSFFGPKYLPNTVLYNNLENFFTTGSSQKHNINLEWGRGITSYRVSGTYSDQKGVIPNTRYTRANARFTVFTRVSRKFDITASGSYAYNINKKAFRGAGGYMLNLLLWPQDDDASQYLKDNGGRRIISKQSVTPGAADNFAEANNPYFDVNLNKNFDKVNRVNMNIGLNYDPLTWLNVSLKVAADGFNQFGAYLLHPESANAYTIGGRIEEYNNRFKGFTSVFMATAKKKVGNFTFTARVGQSVDDRTTTIWSSRGDSVLNVNAINFNNINVDGFTTTTFNKRSNSRITGRDTLVLERVIGVFGDVNINYKDFVYLNLTGRNDWLAEFPPKNRSYFYPSASMSFVFSELTGDNKFFNFGKLRASVAQTGKRITPYANQSVYTSSPGITNSYGVAYDFTNNNPNLFPERQTTFETGLEFKFFENRVNLDFTYYNTFVDRQVVAGLRASYATGYVLNTLNAASIRNEGLEAILQFHWVKTKNFNWRTNVNFNKMWNKVTSLPSTLREFYNSDSFLAGFRASLFLNTPTTTIAGQDYFRNSKGQILIDPGTGYPLTNPDYQSIGDRNPDFVLGIQNRLSYKNLSFSFLFDVKVGGDVLNGTEQWMAQTGLSVRTLDRERVRIIPGVLRDGLEETANASKNTIQINPYFQNDYYTGRTYAVDFVEHDVNWVRLKDVTLSYSFGKKLLNKLGAFQSASLFATGTDLFILTNYSGPDPGVNGNTPATGGVGSFGIDYGNTALPIGVNFGLRVTFKNKK